MLEKKQELVPFHVDSPELHQEPITKVLKKLQDNNPFVIGNKPSYVCKLAGIDIPKKDIYILERYLLIQKLIKPIENKWILNTYTFPLNKKQVLLQEKVLSVLAKKECSVLKIVEIAKELSVPIQAVESLLHVSVLNGQLWYIGPNFILTDANYQRLLSIVLGYGDKEFILKEFISDAELKRDIAIQFLEYLDKIYVTSRLNEKRILLK